MISNDKVMNQAYDALEGKRIKSIVALALFWLIPFILLVIMCLPFGDSEKQSAIVDFTLNFIYFIAMDMLSVGILYFFYNIYKARPCAIADLFQGFKYFGRNIKISLLLVFAYSIIGGLAFQLPLKYITTLPQDSSTTLAICIIYLIFAIVFAWTLTYKTFPSWIAINLQMALDESTPALQLIKETYRDVHEYNFQYLKLILKFIGWLILCVVTFGIAYLWVAPYISESITILTARILEHDTDDDEFPPREPSVSDKPQEEPHKWTVEE